MNAIAPVPRLGNLRVQAPATAPHQVARAVGTESSVAATEASTYLAWVGRDGVSNRSATLDALRGEAVQLEQNGVADLRNEKFDESANGLTKAIVKAAEGGASRAKMKELYALLGLAHERLGDPEKARAALDEAAKLGPPTPMLNILQARLLSNGSENQRAMELLEAALKDLSEGDHTSNERYFQVLAVNWSADSISSLGNVDAALEKLEEAQALADKFCFPDLEATAATNAANELALIGTPEALTKAEEKLGEARGAAEKAMEKDFLRQIAADSAAYVEATQARIWLNQERFPEAHAALVKARDFADQAGPDNWNLSSIEADTALALIGMGDVGEARGHAEASLEIAEGLKDLDRGAEAHEALARLAEAEGDVPTLKQEWEKVIDHYESSGDGDPDLAAQSKRSFAHALLKVDPLRAKQLLVDAAEQFRSLETPTGNQQAALTDQLRLQAFPGE
jgi:tetratricopeptide (TPR) repeat protein